MKKFLIAGAILLVVLGGIVGFKALQIADLIGFATQMEAAGMPPSSVATAVAAEQDWEETLQFVGTLRPVQGVTLTAELGGVVRTIEVENGARVEKGQILMQLDTTQEVADLASADARLRLAQVNLERAKGLLEKRIVPRSEYDSAAAAYDEARAVVANLQAIINKKVIRAPFAGRVGIRLVNLGQTVRIGEELIPLHQNDPIFVDFAVPQTRLAGLKVGQTIRLSSDGLEAPVPGKIEAINPVINETTRTAVVQGLIQNPDDRLRAGQFGMVDVVLSQGRPVLAIPSSAVISEAFGDSVYVVEKNDKGEEIVRQQFVQLGVRKGDFVAVTKGLNPGERVVSAGAFKLTNGARVQVNDAMQPEASTSPRPQNS
ncbi:MAG: efflux RND transporter periplasmic adaptor subunit [Terrimicrobiaceae bacterium]|nr:efflux RND transporter periplasmic adaptor subunit [Terrimicrobiaceae bacterium]